MSFSDAPISFPGLFGDWQFTVPSKALNIGNGIYWYGIIIAAGMLLGLYFCMKQAHKYGLTEDNVIDTVLWAIRFPSLVRAFTMCSFTLTCSATATARSTGRRPTASGTAALPSTAASLRAF